MLVPARSCRCSLAYCCSAEAREAAAEAFGKKLIFHQEILDDIAVKFARRKLVMNDMQNPQAMVPGNRMTYAGMSIASDRADLIAFLAKATQY